MAFAKTRKISTKVMLSFALIVLFQGALSILTLSYVTNRAMQSSLEDQRRKTRLLIEKYFTDARKEMIVKADLLAGQAKIVDFVEGGQDGMLWRELSFYLAPLKLDTILVIDERGEKVAAAGNSEIADVLLKRNPLDLLAQGSLTTIAGEGNRIHLWGLHAIGAPGNPKGMIGVATSLDRSFIGRVEEISSTQMLLTLRKTIPVNGRVSDNVFIEYNRRVAADPLAGQAGKIGAYVYRTTYLPEYPELEMVYFIDTAPSIRLMSNYVASTLAILAIALLVAFWISVLLYRYSFLKPFAAFQKAIREISRGDLSFRFSRDAADEFADLEREFENMTVELKKLESKLQISSRMAAIGEMVAGVAHQIRNPLAIMKVSAEMIRDGLPPERAKPLADMMVSEVDSLSAVVTKFLDFTRPLKVNREEVELGDFLARTVSLLPMERYPGRRVEVDAGPGPLRASLDPHLMEQALQNLLVNALEASKEGQAVRLAAGREDGLLRLRVADSGCGMAEEVRSQLFHPFFTTKSDGTGLGLSIVHRIVEAHGGLVEARSEPGAGTEFAITLGEGA